MVIRAAVAGAVSIAMALAIGLGIHAQSRETLETEVSADGDVIFLKWSQKHPWDKELQAAAPALLAEYRAPNGSVGTDCLRGSAPAAPGRGRVVRGAPLAGCGVQGMVRGKPTDRMVAYRLPEELTATPAGQVCLYFQLPN